jgi:hypothetical protein
MGGVTIGPKERMLEQRVVDRSHRRDRHRHRHRPRLTSTTSSMLVLNIVLYTVALVLIDILFVL